MNLEPHSLHTNQRPQSTFLPVKKVNEGKHHRIETTIKKQQPQKILLCLTNSSQDTLLFQLILNSALHTMPVKLIQDTPLSIPQCPSPQENETRLYLKQHLIHKFSKTILGANCIKQLKIFTCLSCNYTIQIKGWRYQPEPRSLWLNFRFNCEAIGIGVARTQRLFETGSRTLGFILNAECCK